MMTFEVDALNRRSFMTATALGGAALAVSPTEAAAKTRNVRRGDGFLKAALALPLRHNNPRDIEADLFRYREKGFTGIYLENDYILADAAPDPLDLFYKNWRLFNIYDFTLSKANEPTHSAYLDEMLRLCERADLDVYMSFWMPKLSKELFDDLKQNTPRAIGGSNFFELGAVPTFCVCKQGDGLPIMDTMVRKFMRRFPRVAGFKIGVWDNSCFICDSTCPYAHGSDTGDHLANLFETVQTAMLAESPSSKLMLYPWFWSAQDSGKILPKLKKPYHVLIKSEMGTTHQLEQDIPGEVINDATMLSGVFSSEGDRWIKEVGADNIFDMVSVGTSIEDFFISGQPRPGTLYRRLQLLREKGIRSTLEFECGGHGTSINQEAVALFNDRPDLNQDAFYTELAARTYRSPRARAHAINGWKAYEAGHGALPVTLGQTGLHPVSIAGRMGVGVAMCISTPLDFTEIRDEDAKWEIHWFSPYNFITTKLADRFLIHFTKVLSRWQESNLHLNLADELEGRSLISHQAAVSASAHVLSTLSIINWCNAAILKRAGTNAGRFVDLARNEIALTEQFYQISRENPWLYHNSCWHPDYTPLSQKIKGLSTELVRPGVSAFEVKMKLMRESLTAV
jgi:hypothetical protein